MAITAQEAWIERPRAATLQVPEFVREVVEEIAFQAREDKKIDKRSGVSQRLPISLLENVVSNAERRALLRRRRRSIVPRVTDIYAALPAITGKFELEYEGELRGRRQRRARHHPRRRRQRLRRLLRRLPTSARSPSGSTSAAACRSTTRSRPRSCCARTCDVQGLHELTHHAGVRKPAKPPLVAAAVDFILEGLYAQKKITARTSGSTRAPSRRAAPPRNVAPETMIERDVPLPGNKKKYYN